MIRFNNIKVREDLSEEELISFLCKKEKLFLENVKEWHIVKKSIDARNKSDVFYNYTVDMEYDGEYDLKGVVHIEKEKLEDIVVRRKSSDRPIIIGCGPAGLFCALTLIENGVKPIIFEQGSCVDERVKDIEEFRMNRKLNTLSNIQFGEGGAGTFSDGKLTTGINSSFCNRVLEIFHKFGAPKEILYINKPHIGTDNLINIIRNMREYIKSLGGEFHFNEKIDDFIIEDGKIVGVIGKDKYYSDTVILAIGHSARDTFYKLYEYDVLMEKKNFSVGVRIEHKQSMINDSQYGNVTKLKLPPAEYKLVYHGDNRSCYSFCMCPGGYVMASSSEENSIVTNGMSEFKRDGENANSALLVNVLTTDLGDSPLSGINFQERLEKEAFVLGGSNYNAPIQRVEDFLNNRKSTFVGEVKPTYLPGVTLSNLNDILPEFVSKTLKEGIIYFDKKIKGFASGDAILTGVETRSSSPVRINRNEEFVSSILGLYPCGEGPGYAGGIMSAAVDGIKCAIKILEKDK
jgi:uncharacterized FAD-dependent dehydrogenase